LGGWGGKWVHGKPKVLSKLGRAEQQGENIKHFYLKGIKSCNKKGKKKKREIRGTESCSGSRGPGYMGFGKRKSTRTEEEVVNAKTV